MKGNSREPLKVLRYLVQTKPHIKALIKNQLKEMGSAKIIMTLWVRWKKSIEPLIELDPENLKDAQDTEGNAGDKGWPTPPPPRLCETKPLGNG